MRDHSFNSLVILFYEQVSKAGKNSAGSTKRINNFNMVQLEVYSKYFQFVYLWSDLLLKYTNWKYF